MVDRHAEELRAVWREFVEGLPERERALRQALEQLKQGYSRPAAEAFYLKAHSLKGTAGAFQADELVPPAATLAAKAKRWLQQERAGQDELDEAARDLALLVQAMASYKERWERERG